MPARYSLRYLGIVVVTFCVLVGVADLHAQHDSRGRQFWVSFLPNLGSGGEGENSDLRLYLSSEVPTTARVIYHMNLDTLVVPMPTRRTTYEVDISGEFGSDVEILPWETTVRKVVEVLADDDITLYGVNIRSKSADAFLGLPDDVLTTAYIVLAYPNAWDGSDYDQPSMFAVVGTEDGTNVTITPSTDLVGRGRARFSVGLNRGEVFLGRARTGQPGDVSGTEVKSTKPVAVFGGNRRTSIPLSIGNFRDHLVEQIPPLAVWGIDAVVTPHFTIWPPAADSPAVVRVLAAFDNTPWQLDGVPQPPLQRGRSIEIRMLQPMYISAARPILVAQYEHSVDDYVAGGESAPGDPFMMIVPPIQQYDTAYAFQAVSHPEFHPWAHFVNVIIPQTAASSLLIDGDSLPNINWLPVPKAGYVYAQIRIDPGSHYIRAAEPFGMYSYGFGPASSYGYTAGSLYRTLVHDFEPPELEQSAECDRITGMAYDDRITDTGVDSLYQLPRSINVDVTIDPFTPGDDTVRFTARLRDPFQDGEIAMKAIDSGGRSYTLVTPVPGFTLRTVGMTNSPIRLDTFALFNGSSQCSFITIENYGRFERTITRVSLRSSLPGASVRTQLPLTIPPGGRGRIEVCMSATRDTSLLTEVIIGDDCFERLVAFIPVEAWTDTIAPGINSLSDCGDEVRILVREPGVRHAGIDSYRWDLLQNAEEISSIRDSNASVVSEIELRLRRLDPRQDIIYELTVIDEAGNRSVRRDTIGGFTLALLNVPGDTIGVRTGRNWESTEMFPGESRCDSVILVNYGLRPLTVDWARFVANVGFSLPPAQFPLVVPPGGRVRLAFCIRGMIAGVEDDTLMIVDKCQNVEPLALKVPVAGKLTGMESCGRAVSVATVGPARRAFVSTPLPNPADGQMASVDIGLVSATSVDLVLVSADGARIFPLFDGLEFTAGIHRILIDISTVAAGSYLCRMSTSDGFTDASRMIIVR